MSYDVSGWGNCSNHHFKRLMFDSKRYWWMKERLPAARIASTWLWIFMWYTRKEPQLTILQAWPPLDANQWKLSSCQQHEYSSFLRCPHVKMMAWIRDDHILSTISQFSRVIYMLIHSVVISNFWPAANSQYNTSVRAPKAESLYVHSVFAYLNIPCILCFHSLCRFLESPLCCNSFRTAEAHILSPQNAASQSCSSIGHWLARVSFIASERLACL